MFLSLIDFGIREYKEQGELNDRVSGKAYCTGLAFGEQD